MALHWLIAGLIIFLLGLGLWMTELDYYDPWYQKGPDLHRSLGVITVGLVFIRIIWRRLNIQPEKYGSKLEQSLAKSGHTLLYLLPFLLGISGYLISTADGRAVDVFSWFSIPAIITDLPQQEDIAGWIHYILGLVLIVIISLHVLAALKHHFIDKDKTLLRIFGK